MTIGNKDLPEKILFISGTPRPGGNSELLAKRCAAAAEEEGAEVTFLSLRDMQISGCVGCLRCNRLKKCANTDDDWAKLRDALIGADTVVFASPVYFHDVTGVMKNAIDRFRSVLHVTFTAGGLIHDPVPWEGKTAAVILSQGAPVENDFEIPLRNLAFFAKLVCGAEKVSALVAKGLTISGQVEMEEKKLRAFWKAAKLDPDAFEDFAARFRGYRDSAGKLGRCLASGRPEDYMDVVECES
ncbi:MAG: flavodoxin family protein [Planctomycetota bacterium]|jgi:multimeric flavodoxin WrbA